MKNKSSLTGVVVLLLSPVFVSAQPTSVPYNNLELVVANYGITFGQQFLGKILRGNNVLESFGKSLYEALPSTALQYTGMKMVGNNWRWALPAQVLVQKGAQIQRRSILGLPVFSPTLLTSWEIDYLWFNLRVDDGKVLFPRINMTTFATSIFFAAISDSTNIMVKESLTTGTVIQTGLHPGIPSALGGSWAGNILLRNRNLIRDMETVGHEFVHVQQYIRGNTLIDVLSRQDFSQSRSDFSFLRFDGMGMGLVFLTSCIPQKLTDKPCHFVEREANGYSEN